MKKLLLIIVAAIALASCSDNDKVISKRKMASILRDIHISDAVLNTQRYTQNTFENLDSLYLYKDVFEKNDVSRDEFVYSLQYYSKYPRKLDEIYTMVVNDLSSQQAKMREDMEKKGKGRKPKMVE
jgi:outer membrane murein-binding lipoprotein Lpp